MARNRRTEPAAIRFGPAVKAVLLCLLIGGAGVGYVWQKDQITRLGDEKKKRELRLIALDEQNENLRKQLAFMRRPQFLEMRIKELNLGLVQPLPSQIIRLPEPLPGSFGPATNGEAKYVASQGKSQVLAGN
jgi:hypothetical protein